MLFSHSVMSNFLWPHGLQHTKIPCLSHSPRICSNSCPSNQWWHPTILTSVSSFSSCPQSFPAAGSFSMSQLFKSGDQNIGVSASASVIPMSIQGWFPLGLTVPEMRRRIKSIYFKLIKMYYIKFQFYIFSDQFISVQSLNPVWLFVTHGLQHARHQCPSATPGVYSNLCPLSPCCHPTISSSVIPFSSCLQSSPASGPFPMSQLFTSGGQSIRVSASVLPTNIQDWFPLGWSGWISFQSKGLSSIFSNTTVQKHQFFGTQLSL